MIIYGNIYSRFFQKKERNGDLGSIATLLSETTVAILWRNLQKQLEAYKVGHWKFSKLKIFIIFCRDDTIKEEEVRGWRKKALFSAASSTPPSPSDISTPAGENTIEFMK